MSTKLEELSDLDIEETKEDMQDFDDFGDFEDLEDLDVHEEFEEKVKTKKESEAVTDLVKSYFNTGLMSSMYDKIKEPTLVMFITMIITNPVSSQIVTSLPYANITTDGVKLNLILSILAGILFFVIRFFI